MFSWFFIWLLLLILTTAQAKVEDKNTELHHEANKQQQQDSQKVRKNFIYKGFFLKIKKELLFNMGQP